MTAQILNGTKLASARQQALQKQLQLWYQAGGRQPGLAVILVGDDRASIIYTQKKRDRCQELGFLSRYYHFANARQNRSGEVIELIQDLNQDPAIDGILVQLPLPAGWPLEAILGAIDPSKDVDGFHPCNLGKLAWNWPGFISCTARGIIQLIATTDTPLAGLNTLIVSASNVVGKPLALELLKQNATVTIAHRYTKNLSNLVRQAELLVSAVGIKDLILGEWVQPGAIVIDAGIVRDPVTGQSCGDLQFTASAERAAWITPVPGGVGPMTVQNLMENSWLACRLHQQASVTEIRQLVRELDQQSRQLLQQDHR